MAKFCAYLFLFVLVIHTSPLSQLLKLPVLFTHFADHKHRNHNISFTEFLSMHYWGKDINDNDTQEDNKLPFKKANCISCISLFMPVKKMPAVVPVMWFRINYVVPDDPALPNAFHCSLFRPPKQAPLS